MSETATIAPNTSLFDNYTKLPQRVPTSVWMVARLFCLALALAEIATLLLRPELGLTLFWAIIVPCLPALFAIAPGLWRQVCPMAFLNQLPQMGGFGLARTLPVAMRYWSYVLGIVVLIAMVSLRRPLLNATGWATAALCGASLVLAFVGGVIYKGRSGWCGTFCPLAPVQRSHGQAPLVVVRNGYCPTCVGCQKNCFDFNPRAAIFGDLNDSDHRHAQQRVFFMSMLPGLIWGYYAVPAAKAASGLPTYWLELGASMAVSISLFVTLRALLKLSNYRLLTAFGMVALLLYYWNAGPILVDGVSSLLDLRPAPMLLSLSRWIAVPIVIGVWRSASSAERAYQGLDATEVRVRVEDIGRRGAASGSGAPIMIHERGSNKRFPASADKTLLEAMEAAGVPIDFGCRLGLCGADPVGIVDGHDQLDAPGADEAATLRRLGLTGRARLACCARTRGPVTIDRDPRSVPAPTPAAVVPAAPPVDRAAAAGIAKVVIVGNGVAGMTVAEALREASESVEISVITEETHHFYNRMALGRIIVNRSSMDGMFLLPDGWCREHRVGVWLNTSALAIDRVARQVRLGTGERLPYDRLVLATGAAAASPSADFDGQPNAFVLRTASDAQAIRAFVQRHGLRRAVVVGGGVLGVEAAEALHHLDLQVTLVHRGAGLMDRQLDAEGARRLASYLQAKGIVALTGARVQAYEGQGRLSAARLEDGRRIEADLFVACAGIAPRTELARAAGLEIGRGIRVNAGMASSDPSILAVGDVAEPSEGVRSGGPAGLWPVAVAHGRAAVATMLGEPVAAAPPRVVLQLKSEGIDLRSFGDVGRPPADAEVLVAAASASAWWHLVLRDGQALAAVFVGPPGSAKALTRALQNASDLSAALPALRRGELALE